MQNDDCQETLLQGKMLIKDFGTEGRQERGEHKLRLHKLFNNNKSQAKGGSSSFPYK